MAVGQNGRPSASTVPAHGPKAFASRVGAHIHKGAAQATVGGPGCTTAPGANQSGSSGQNPYTDSDHDGV